MYIGEIKMILLYLGDCPPIFPLTICQIRGGIRGGEGYYYRRRGYAKDSRGVLSPPYLFMTQCHTIIYGIENFPTIYGGIDYCVCMPNSS